MSILSVLKISLYALYIIINSKPLIIMRGSWLF